MYINFNENLTLFNSIGTKGAYIRIENSSYLNDETLDNGIYIAPGKWTNALVNRVFKYILPMPYSNCELDGNSVRSQTTYELVKQIAHSPYEYTQQTCMYLCLQKQLIVKCNCTYPFYFSLVHSEDCSTSVHLDCYNQVFLSLFKNNSNQAACLRMCPLECDRTEYEYSVSEIDLFGDLFADYINEHQNLLDDYYAESIDSDTAKQSVAQFSIFYYSLSYTLMTESAKMDVVALLASIGGNLGLFMGVSLISICEIVEVIYEIFLLMKKHNASVISN